MQSDLDEHLRLSSDTLQDDDEPSPYDDQHDVLNRRISLGPKMRFHSPAPWELDDDASPDDKLDYPPTFLSPKKAFPFSIAKSIESGRTSGESHFSQAKSKLSFETTSSQASYPRGALYALARESFSTTSLVSSTGQHRSRGKPSLNLSRSKSPQTLAHLEPPYSASRSFTDPSFHNRDSSHATSNRSTYVVDDFHPYANPDLLSSYLQDQSQALELSRGISKSSVASSVPSSPLLNVPKMASINSRRRSTAGTPRSPSKLKKDISSPVDLRVDGITLRAWKDRRLPFPKSEVIEGDDLVAPFSLISLEEARAQRSENNTPCTTDYPLPNPFPPMLEEKLQGVRDSMASSPEPRPRSISIGAKARNSRQSTSSTIMPKITRQTSPGKASVKDGSGGKTLKHRKSGFLKLFNSRTTDHGGTIHYTHYKEWRTAPDVPVPELPPALFHPKPQKVVHHECPTSPRAPPPSPPQEAINTPPISPRSDDVQPAVTTDHSSMPPPSVTVQQPTDSRCDSDGQETSPRGSIPVASDLPTLQLRPVSSIFSEQFTEHLISPGSSPNGTVSDNSPLTASSLGPPSLADQHSHSSMTGQAVVAGCESPTSVILRLQEEILVEKSKRLEYQRQRLELEERVNELQEELAKLRVSRNLNGFCIMCGSKGVPANSSASRSKDFPQPTEEDMPPVTRRPRARTATSRFSRSSP